MNGLGSLKPKWQTFPCDIGANPVQIGPFVLPSSRAHIITPIGDYHQQPIVDWSWLVAWSSRLRGSCLETIVPMSLGDGCFGGPTIDQILPALQRGVPPPGDHEDSSVELGTPSDHTTAGSDMVATPDRASCSSTFSSNSSCVVTHGRSPFFAGPRGTAISEHQLRCFHLGPGPTSA